MQEDHSNGSRVAQHALVLGPVAMSSQIPLCLPNLLTQLFNQIPHKKVLSLNLHTWLLEPQKSSSKAFLRQWRHELRLHKEAQPNQSMKQSGPGFTKWCHSNQMDFNAPPIKSIDVFLLYLFQDRKLQQSTIDGQSILGNSNINVSKGENLARLLDSFQETGLRVTEASPLGTFR